MFLREILLITAMALQCAPTAAPVPALVLDGEAAEAFLLTAEVTDLEEFDTKGITKPRKATLSDGVITLYAVFKDIDVVHTKQKLTTGRTVFNLKDSYRHEIAAYELDKLLGLGIVPPTVERKIGRNTGSLQMWVNGAMTEWQRLKEKKLSPPDAGSWNNQMSTVKVFLQLTWDTDYNNVANLLIDESWKIWKIDSSRAFRIAGDLRRAEALTRFSRKLLAALVNLDRAELEAAMEPWLSSKQIKALWERRVDILELADERVAEHGEAAVLYD